MKTDVGRIATSAWWLLLLQGIVAVIVGLLMVSYPAATLAVIALYIGVYFLISGFFAFVRLFTVPSRWFWALLNGILGVLAGLFIFICFTARSWFRRRWSWCWPFKLWSGGHRSRTWLSRGRAGGSYPGRAGWPAWSVAARSPHRCRLGLARGPGSLGYPWRHGCHFLGLVSPRASPSGEPGHQRTGLREDEDS